MCSGWEYNFSLQEKLIIADACAGNWKMGKSTLKKWKEVLHICLRCVENFESFQDRVTFIYID